MSFRHLSRHIRHFIGREMARSTASGSKVGLSVLPIVLLLLGLLSASVQAQFDEPASIKIGESDFIPTARFEYLQFSNAFLSADDPTEVTAFVIKPRARWVADRRLLSITGIYDGAYASYSESALNYADHSLTAVVDAELSSRSRVRTSFAFNFGHQALGTDFTRGTDNPEDTEQVEFINTSLVGSYTYGARSARGNMVLGLRLNNRSYQNQKALTNGRDYTLIGPFGQFSYRLSSDTRAIATLRYSGLTYDDENLSRGDISLLTGLRFAATGKSGGEFQLGASLTDFDRSSRDDVTSFVAEAELFYEPSTFSRFELTAGREIDNNSNDLIGLDSALSIADFAQLNWQHEWSSRFYHVADLTYRLESRDCPADFDSLARATGRFELNLVLQRWLHVGASLQGDSREIDECQNNAGTVDLDFESQVFGAHIRATL